VRAGDTGNEPLGLAQLAFLDFDSAIYDSGVGRIEYVVSAGPGRETETSLLERAVNLARELRWTHLWFRIPGTASSTVHAAQQAGFRFISTNIHLQLALANWKGPSVAAPEVTNARAVDLAALRRITREAFSAKTRFHLDPQLPSEQGTRLHEAWIENAMNGEADVVLTARDGEPRGFITCRVITALKAVGLDVADIDLFAVATGDRRRGFGGALVDACLGWCRDRGIRFVTVDTESLNAPALNRYLRSGFAVSMTSHAFHLHLR